MEGPDGDIFVRCVGTENGEYRDLALTYRFNKMIRPVCVHMTHFSNPVCLLVREGGSVRIVKLDDDPVC